MIVYNLNNISNQFVLAVFVMPLLFAFDFLLSYKSWLYFIYLLPLLLIYSLLCSYVILKSEMLNKGRIIYFIALLLIVLVNFSADNISFSIYVFVIFFFCFIFSTSVFSLDKAYYKLISVVILFYFVLSFVLLFHGGSYVFVGDQYRFRGLALSPTTNGIIMLVFYVFFLNLSKSYFLKVVVYFVMIIILFKGESRIDIVMGMMLPLYYFAANKKIYSFNKSYVFLLGFFFIAFMYPIYDYVSFSELFPVLRENTDASDSTRLYYNMIMLDQISESGLVRFFLGNGLNSSLLLIGDYKIKPHNDYLRLIYEFGFLFFVLFVYMVYDLYKRSGKYSYIVFVYLSSFFHNMVFDPLLFILVFFVIDIMILWDLSVMKINCQVAPRQRAFSGRI